MQNVVIIKAYGDNLYLVAVPDSDSFQREHMLRLCKARSSVVDKGRVFDPVSMPDELYTTLKGCGLQVIQH